MAAQSNDDNTEGDRKSGSAASTSEVASAVQAGEKWVKWGGVLAAIGGVAALIALLPLVTDAVKPASWLWFVAIGGVGVGVGMALWGMVRAARARSRYLRAG